MIHNLFRVLLAPDATDPMGGDDSGVTGGTDPMGADDQSGAIAAAAAIGTSPFGNDDDGESELPGTNPMGVEDDAPAPAPRPVPNIKRPPAPAGSERAMQEAQQQRQQAPADGAPALMGVENIASDDLDMLEACFPASLIARTAARLGGPGIANLLDEARERLGSEDEAEPAPAPAPRRQAAAAPAPTPEPEEPIVERDGFDLDEEEEPYRRPAPAPKPVARHPDGTFAALAPPAETLHAIRAVLGDDGYNTVMKPLLRAANQSIASAKALSELQTQYRAAVTHLDSSQVHMRLDSINHPSLGDSFRGLTKEQAANRAEVLKAARAEAARNPQASGYQAVKFGLARLERKAAGQQQGADPSRRGQFVGGVPPMGGGRRGGALRPAAPQERSALDVLVNGTQNVPGLRARGGYVG